MASIADSITSTCQIPKSFKLSDMKSQDQMDTLSNKVTKPGRPVIPQVVVWVKVWLEARIYLIFSTS
jgi:hypothetical protein